VREAGARAVAAGPVAVGTSVPAGPGVQSVLGWVFAGVFSHMFSC
jgi:hypothetical protein